MKFSIKSKIKKYITYLKYVTSVWSSTVQQSMCCMRLCMPIPAPSFLGSRIQVEMKKRMYKLYYVMFSMLIVQLPMSNGIC